MPTYLVTGGAGFIGSAYVLQARHAGITIVNLDKLTYSGNLDNLTSVRHDPQHIFVRGDIGNDELLSHLLATHSPQVIINFAAESHVDRSIHDPDAFIRTNVLGTSALLRASVAYWKHLPASARQTFRFVHISTDEVFGALGPHDAPFTESTAYAPNSPYSASKAGSDHLVRAFHETYGLPVVLTNCSNNYGPRQFPEKLIPLTILNALAGKPLPIYGKGDNIRDWLHVEDHCRAIQSVVEHGRVGQSYNIGGHCERTNIALVRHLCTVLHSLRPCPQGHYHDLITPVADRPGHDFRYAINCTKIEQELGWKPLHTFEQGLRSTVQWYLDNPQWVERIHTGAYSAWLQQNYAQRT
ncbi:MAG: dTDP-glucose 4,6-dehydratase [Desulfovibrionaceae bacterium]